MYQGENRKKREHSAQNREKTPHRSDVTLHLVLNTHKTRSIRLRINTNRPERAGIKTDHSRQT